MIAAFASAKAIVKSSDHGFHSGVINVVLLAKILSDVGAGIGYDCNGSHRCHLMNVHFLLSLT